MPAVTAAALEPVNAFPVEKAILIKHYFDGDEVFDRLWPYYDGSQSASRCRSASSTRSGGSCVDAATTSRWSIARRRSTSSSGYTAHPEDVFERSVRQESVDGYNCFLMKDEAAVEDAVAQGATRLSEGSISVAAGTLGDFATTSPSEGVRRSVPGHAPDSDRRISSS